jgi:MFS superfamily sulfate permease-like transporter
MAPALISGALCIAAGFARLGFLTNFLARPILTGYLNGIALSIIAGQLGRRLFGFSLAPAGIFLIISIAAAKAPIRFILDRTGATERIGSDRHYPSVAAAVESLLQM